MPAAPRADDDGAGFDELLTLMCSGYSKSFNLGKQVPGMAALLPARDGSAATNALVFLMQVDNRGPPTADDVIAG